MAATDLLRHLLDIIDSIDAMVSQPAAEPECGCGHEVEVVDTGDEEMRRLRSVLGLASDGDTQYSNSPDERVAGIEAVTVDAGGGVNGPKHPADIRGNSFSLFPDFQVRKDG